MSFRHNGSRIDSAKAIAEVRGVNYDIFSNENGSTSKIYKISTQCEIGLKSLFWKVVLEQSGLGWCERLQLRSNTSIAKRTKPGKGFRRRSRLCWRKRHPSLCHQNHPKNKYVQIFCCMSILQQYNFIRPVLGRIKQKHREKFKIETFVGLQILQKRYIRFET